MIIIYLICHFSNGKPEISLLIFLLNELRKMQQANITGKRKKGHFLQKLQRGFNTFFFLNFILHYFLYAAL